MLGFRAGNDIKENGDLNAGLLDQRAGIEWVPRHISAFGGDPDEVTFTGASASGGISVYLSFWLTLKDPSPFT